MENVLFKISFPAEFHAQTAVEARDDAASAGARSRSTRSSAIVIDDAGVRRSASSTRRARSHNPADRDHCIQYMVAVPLIFGRLTAADYEDAVAADPRIDALRAQDEVRRGPAVHAATTSTRTSARSPTASRSCSTTARARPRSWSNIRSAIAAGASEGIPLLIEKFRTNLARRFAAKQQQAILDAALEPERLAAHARARVRRPVRDPYARSRTNAMRIAIAAYSLSCCSPAPPAAARVRPGLSRSLKPGLWEFTRQSDRPTDKGTRHDACASTRRVQTRDAGHAGMGAVARACAASTTSRSAGNAAVGDFDLQHGRQHDALEVGHDLHRRQRRTTPRSTRRYDPPMNGQTRSAHDASRRARSARASRASGRATSSCRTARRSTCATDDRADRARKSATHCTETATP